MPENKPPVTGRYIDPLVDFAFKKIFGSEPNKDLLIAFLNEVFKDVDERATLEALQSYFS